MSRMSRAGRSPRALLVRLDEVRAGGAYERFVDRTDTWMLALAVAFLVVLVWPLIDRDISPELRNGLH